MSRDFRKHADLFDRMATRVGVDLEEALFRGRLQPGDLSGAVLACTDCSDPQDCARWLDRSEAEGGPRDRPPGYCRNGDLLAALKP